MGLDIIRLSLGIIDCTSASICGPKGITSLNALEPFLIIVVSEDFQSSNKRSKRRSVVVIPVESESYLTKGPTSLTSIFNFYAIS